MQSRKVTLRLAQKDICRNPAQHPKPPHLNPLVEQLAIRLSPQAGKSLVIPQAGEEAIENNLLRLWKPAMPKANVTFENIGLTVSVPAGTRLIEISEKVGAGITYGCREGECCTCTVKVVSGMENMSERSVLEDKVLQENMAGRNDRLACQAQVLGGDIIVKA